MIRINRDSLGVIRTLLLVSLFGMGLAASTAAPALAGSGGFNNTGAMNFARYTHTATLLSNGEVLVTGGYNYKDGYLASAELYNPANGKWTLTGSTSVPRVDHEAVRLQNGQVLVAGGSDTQAPCCGAPPLASAELYNPSTGNWTATGSMTTGRESFALTLLANGRVLAAGGDNGSGGILSSAELYNPATGTWTATGSMPIGTATGWAVLLQNGNVFVGAVNLYHPSTGTWTTASSPPISAGGPVALLPNGDVFSGGTIRGGVIYTPSTNQWITFPPPPCTTFHQNCEAAGALLQTGKVLVAGGVTQVNAQPYPIEETNGIATLFDPSTLTWASTGSLKQSRIGETMTVLPNGQALVAGGETFDKGAGHLVPIASAELYTP